MSPAGEPVQSAMPALRCARCGTAVAATCHTRTGYVVGYYLLHGGPTEEATLRRRAEEAVTAYRRLLDVVETVTCPACYRRPEMRRLWEAFGEAESSAA
jgi:hypothetical protein